MNKAIFWDFIRFNELSPKTELVSLEKSNFEEITALFTQEKVIIKPTNCAQGHGVELVATTHLLERLKKIVKNISKIGTDDYCFYSRSPYLLIQEFCPSEVLKIDSHDYLPTGRIVLEASYIDANIHLKHLGSYWKLPASSAENTLNTESVVSAMHDEKRAQPIAEKTIHAIFEILKEKFSPVLEEMFLTNADELQKNCEAHPVLNQYFSSMIQRGSPIQIDKNPFSFTRDALTLFHNLEYGSVNSLNYIEYFKYAVMGLDPLSLLYLMSNIESSDIAKKLISLLRKQSDRASLSLFKQAGFMKHPDKSELRPLKRI